LICPWLPGTFEHALSHLVDEELDLKLKKRAPILCTGRGEVMKIVKARIRSAFSSLDPIQIPAGAMQ
jgi:hypothetical protein